jgi:hypothetical protein
LRVQIFFKLNFSALIESADKDFFASIDEETERRVQELEEEERLKSPRTQRLEQIERDDQQSQSDTAPTENGSQQPHENGNGHVENGNGLAEDEK